MKKVLLYLYLLYIIFFGTIIDIAGFIFYFFFNGIFLFDFFDRIFHPNSMFYIATSESSFSIIQYNMLLLFFYIFFNIFLALSLKYGTNLLFTTNYQIKNIILTFFYSIIMMIIMITGIYITIFPKLL